MSTHFPVSPFLIARDVSLSFLDRLWIYGDYRCLNLPQLDLALDPKHAPTIFDSGAGRYFLPPLNFLWITSYFAPDVLLRFEISLFLPLIVYSTASLPSVSRSERMT